MHEDNVLASYLRMRSRQPQADVVEDFRQFVKDHSRSSKMKEKSPEHHHSVRIKTPPKAIKQPEPIDTSHRSKIVKVRIKKLVNNTQRILSKTNEEEISPSPQINIHTVKIKNPCKTSQSHNNSKVLELVNKVANIKNQQMLEEKIGKLRKHSTNNFEFKPGSMFDEEVRQSIGHLHNRSVNLSMEAQFARFKKNDKMYNVLSPKVQDLQIDPFQAPVLHVDEGRFTPLRYRNRSQASHKNSLVTIKFCGLKNELHSPKLEVRGSQNYKQYIGRSFIPSVKVLKTPKGKSRLITSKK